MANQKDVAQIAGVSSATVSRYLSAPETVSGKTAESIKKAIKKLNYRLDYSAQCLKTGRSNRIGIITPGTGPFYWEVFFAIQSALNQEAFLSTLFFSRDVLDTSIRSTRDRIIPFLQHKQVEGLVFFPLKTEEDDRTIEELVRLKENVVIADRRLVKKNVPQVWIQNYEMGKTAAQHLFDAGHRDFLFIWGTHNSPAANERFEGFRDQLKEYGIALDASRMINGDFYAQYTYRKVKEIFPTLPRFSAVFASNDSSAHGFMRAVSELGLKCPKDYSIIGCDNNAEISPYTVPALTTFQQPNDQLGRTAAQMIIRLVNGEKLERKNVSLETQFIERESIRVVNKN